MEWNMPYNRMTQTVVLPRSKKKILLKIAAITCGVFMLIFTALYIFIQVKKDEILSAINKEIAERIKGEVHIGKMDVSLFNHFPSISIVMKDVEVGDSLLTLHHRSLVQLKKMVIDLNWAALFNSKDKVKRITASNGKVMIFTDTTGYTNLYILKNNEKKKPDRSTAMPEVVLLQVEFMMYDLIKEKQQHYQVEHASLKEEDDNVFEADIDIKVHTMVFNMYKGSFVANKILKGKFNFQKNEDESFSFDNIRIQIEQYPFYFTGKFMLQEKGQPFHLVVTADKILYKDVRSFLPLKIATSLAIVQVDQPLNARAEITGLLKGGLPLVNVSWDIPITNLKTPLQNFDSASLTGTFTNEITKGLPRTDPNSRIIIHNFKALWKGLPVHSDKMEILDLSNPVLSCDLVSSFPLLAMNQMTGIQSFLFQKGNCEIRIGYSGPLMNNNSNNSIVNGSVHFVDGKMLYVPRNVLVQNFTGDIFIRNSDVFLHKFNLKLMDQVLSIEANAKNLISMMSADPASAVINFEITSPSLDVQKFNYFFGSRKTVKAKGNSINSVLSKIDDVLEKGKLNIRLLANAIHYKNFDASDVQADVSLLKDRYIVQEIRMKHAGGDMSISGDLRSAGKNYNAALQFNMKGMQVTKLFRSFDNFGQDAITSKNLEGNLTVNSVTNLMLDEKGSILPATINSRINFLLQNGVLQNFEPVKKMQKFVFKNRNFDTIRFADLQNVLEVRQKKIYINRMQIKSSVLTMYVQGVYANDSSSDLSIQLPISNLFKRKDQLNLLNMGNHKSGGSSIYLRGRTGGDGNIEFKLDLFNRFKNQRL